MSHISLFEEKQVRRVWNTTEQKWYFSIDDVVLALTDSANVKDYIKKLRKRDPYLNSYWGTNCPPVVIKLQITFFNFLNIIFGINCFS